jgi:hypothetical protein
MAGPGDAGGEFLRRIAGDVYERDLGFLGAEMLDDTGPDAGPAAVYEHDAVLQAGIDGELVHGALLFRGGPRPDDSTGAAPPPTPFR